MPDFNHILHWATATLSPASVILFIVAMGGVLGAVWFLKELRKADLKLVEHSQQSLLRVKEELAQVRQDHLVDLRKMQELQIDLIEMKYKLTAAEKEIDELRNLLEQSRATIQAILQPNGGDS